jgi:hypothetical protein
MNWTRPARKDGIVAAIGVLVLLLGTATGNAYSMLAIALIGLGVLALFYRQTVGRNALVALTVAAAAAIAVVIAIAMS